MCHCEISKERATHSMETMKVLVLHPAHCKQNGEKGIKLNWHGDKFGLSSLMTVCIPLCDPARHVQVWRVLYLLSLACRRSSRHPHHRISRNFQWNFGAWFVNSRRNFALLCSISIAHSFTVEQFTISPFLSPAPSSSGNWWLQLSTVSFPPLNSKVYLEGEPPTSDTPRATNTRFFSLYHVFQNSRTWMEKADRQTDR